MKKFEYKFIDISRKIKPEFENILNAFGNNGWEIVSINIHNTKEEVNKYYASNVLMKREIN